MKITAEGKWRNPFGDESYTINTSDILTRLIQYAGRYCEQYASDLFYIWENVRTAIEEHPKGYSLLIGFRENGIDDGAIVDTHYEENHFYYRKVVELTIDLDGDDLIMMLFDRI